MMSTDYNPKYTNGFTPLSHVSHLLHK